MYQNEEYSIIESNTEYGLIEYDYIVLEAEKDFYLVWKNGTEEIKYGAELEVYDASIYDENPEEEMYRGELVTVNAPAMRVDKTGMYHIILDLNLGGDLPMPQIVLAPCNWGIRGGGDNNTTRYTDSEPTVEGKKWTWVMDDVELVFEKDALEAIADKTLEKKTGARGLRSIMEKTLLETMYQMPSDETILKCIVTKESAEGSEQPSLLVSGGGQKKGR